MSIKEKIKSGEMKGMWKKHRKKVTISIITVILLGIAGAGTYFGMAYNYAKENDRYSQEEITKIATQYVDGEVVDIHKEWEIEDDQISKSEFEYEVEIKTPDNQLRTVTVLSRTGTIDVDHDDDMDEDHYRTTENVKQPREGNEQGKFQ